MTRYTFTINQEHLDQLKKELIKANGHEGVAFLFCGRSKVDCDPWENEKEERFLSREIYYVSKDDIISTSETEVAFKNEAYIRALKIAESKDYAVALVHSHPPGHTSFSEKDDVGERSLFQLVYNRNGSKRPNLSIIIDQNDNILGRAWDEELNPVPLSLIRIVGKRLHLRYEGRNTNLSKEEFSRQALAFGDALNWDLQQLRIGIIGCGGTGSATAMLLARLGVGKILLIDSDKVEKTNLNRLHGSSLNDVKSQRSKVEVVSNAINSMGLNVQVRTIDLDIENPKCQDTLKSLDFIFGCTDDHLGRMILNRIAYCYLTPVIDMGLAIKVREGVFPPEIQTLEGRSTFLFPGNVCLLCRSVIDPKKARAEQLRKNNPEEYAIQLKEEYVEGERNPSPAVITFTTDLATMAVNELIDRLQGFRNEHGGASERRRYYKTCEERRTGAISREGCSVCNNSTYYGRGDMNPFLDITI